MTALTPLRLRLVGVAFAPAVIGGVGALFPLDATGRLALLACGGLSSVLAAVAIWRLTQPLARLAVASECIVSGEPIATALPPDRTDELGAVVRAFRTLDTRSGDHRAAVTNDATRLTARLVQLADPEQSAAPLELQSLPPDVTESLTAAYAALVRNVANTRQRLTMALRILQGTPAALVAIGENGAIRYMNPAAERVFGRKFATCQRRPFGELLATITDGPADPLGRPVLDASRFKDLFKPGGGEAVVASAASEGPSAIGLTAGAAPWADKDLAWCLVGRDLADERGRLGADRAQTREQTLRAAWTQAVQFGGDAPDRVIAQTRLLANDAKQSAQRDVLLPRVAAIREEAVALDFHLRTVRWLGGEFWHGLPAPRPSEFLAADVARTAADLLAPRLRGRNSSVQIAGEGGWLFADEESVRTALLGLLAHACEATRDTTITLRLRRLAPARHEVESRLAFEVADAGPPLPPDAGTHFGAPFGDLASAPLVDDTAGYWPGLLLAYRLAAGLGGALELDTTPSGRLLLRLVMPTRLPSAPVAEPLPELDGAGPAEELCHGWRLGSAV